MNISKYDILEPATPADYPELVRVWETAVRATHHFLREADIQLIKGKLAQEYFPVVQLHVLRHGAEILGFIGVAQGKVEMLFIDPAHHGRGLGKTLLQQAIQAQQATKVDVNEQNPQALAFYRHLGFEVVGRSALDGMGNPYPLLHLELPG